MDETKDKPTDDLAARLGRGAGRFVRQATPRARKLAADAKPLVDKATQYAVEHQEELKAAGAKALRGRMRGPLGMAFDSFVSAAKAPLANEPISPTSCRKCGAKNPANSRFCNQSASPLS